MRARHVVRRYYYRDSTKTRIMVNNSALYKNRIVKQKTWKELAVKLGIEEDALKKRWKHLKDQYRKEIKKQPVLRSGAESETWESTWQYFNLMSFMKNEVTPASSTGNLTVNETESSHETEYTQSDTDIIEYVSSPGSYNVQSPDGSSGFQTSSTLNIRKRSSIKDDMLEIEKKKLLLMETRLKDSQQDDKLKNDEDFLFLKSILPTMKKLNDLQKLRFRGKINDWLLEACTENERALFQNQVYYSHPNSCATNRSYYTHTDPEELNQNSSFNNTNAGH